MVPALRGLSVSGHSNWGWVFKETEGHSWLGNARRKG